MPRILPRRWRATSGPWALLCTVVGFVYLFSLGPILITAAVSFNQTNRSFFPPRGFSLRWWERAFAPEWIDPLLFSLKLGSLTALLATLLALPLAFALYRYRFAGRNALIALTLGPLMLPTLVTGVGLLQLFQYLGWREYIGFTALLVGHVVICMPFAVRTVSISLPWGVVVSAQASLRLRKPASCSPTVAKTFNKSRVDRAKRSRRVTISTSPGSSRLISLASSARSVFAPETFSLNTLATPAAINSATCAARSWPLVETRA